VLPYILTGVVIASLSLMGEYPWRIDEVSKRPEGVIDEMHEP
jgi:hypothetical protein